MAANQPGQNGVTGVLIKGHFYVEEQVLRLGLHIENHTGQPLSDFNIMVNKNPFGILIKNQGGKI